MQANFHETLEGAESQLPSDRSTGLVLAAAATVAAYAGRSEMLVVAACLSVALTLAGASLANPAALRPLNRAWMGLAHLLNRIVSPVVMLVLYCIAIVPFGIVMQLTRDPLRRRVTDADETFWIVPEVQFGPKDMTRQF
ncbi:MAG: hypothetical protein AB7O57_05830 [Hyphomicrobiaceae bacterium]